MADDPGEIKPGQYITARWLEKLRKLVIAAGRLAVESPLDMIVSPAGRLIRLAGANTKPLFARLTALSGTAYSWVEVSYAGSGGWTPVTNGRHGTLDAWESNLAADLPYGTNGGVVVDLYPGPIADSYRFQYMRNGTATACANLPVIFCSVAGLCCPIGTVTFTLTYMGTTVGTCSSPGTCNLAVNLPPGTVVSYTIAVPGYSDFTGTIAVPGCGGSAGITISLSNLLPDTIHLTDPDGNAVPMNRLGAIGTGDGSVWTGGQSYTRTTGRGGTVSFTMSYRWDSQWCQLQMAKSKDYPEQPPQGAVLFCDGSPNFTEYPFTAWYLIFFTLANWGPPPAPSKACHPLVMVYQPWTDAYFLGNDTSGTSYGLKEGSCNFNNPLFIDGRPLGGYQAFACKSTWTITL